jgi:hypothetical protein
MWVNTNRDQHDGPWTMIAEVRVRNHYGPDCSLKAYPSIVFKEWERDTGRDITRGPTTQTRSDALAEEWVDLLWNPAGRPVGSGEGPLGYFRIYTTNRDAKGSPCPAERILPADELDITVPGMDKTFHVNGMPTDEGPQVTSCDARIAVTPFVQLR